MGGIYYCGPNINRIIEKIDRDREIDVEINNNKSPYSMYVYIYICAQGHRFSDSDHHFAFSEQKRGLCHGKMLILTKVLGTCQLWTILSSKSLSRHGVVYSKFWRHLGQPILRTRPLFRSWLCEPGKPQNYICKNTAFRAIPTRRNDLISHICAVSHLRDHLSLLADLGRQLSVWSEVRFLNFLW